MIRLFLFTMLVASTGMLSSCYRTVTERCAEESLNVQYRGFAVAELDTIMVRRYEPGSAFQTGLGNLQLYADSATFLRRGDTLTPQSSVGYGRLYHGNDYEIFVPRTGRTYRMAAIELEGRTEQTYREAYGVTYDRDPCINRIVSFRLDSVLIATSRVQYEEAYLTLER